MTDLVNNVVVPAWSFLALPGKINFSQDNEKEVGMQYLR
jgi:hypothetical protein